MNMKVYDKVKKILIEHPACRNSDKKLIFNYWVMEGILINQGELYYTNPYAFINGTSAESITRARSKVQELHPELQATDTVKTARKDKEKKKGTFIFNT